MRQHSPRRLALNSKGIRFSRTRPMSSFVMRRRHTQLMSGYGNAAPVELERAARGPAPWHSRPSMPDSRLVERTSQSTWKAEL